MRRQRPVPVERPAPGHYRERAASLLGALPARQPLARHHPPPAPARAVATGPRTPRSGQLLLPVDR